MIPIGLGESGWKMIEIGMKTIAPRTTKRTKRIETKRKKTKDRELERKRIEKKKTKKRIARVPHWPCGIECQLDNRGGD